MTAILKWKLFQKPMIVRLNIEKKTELLEMLLTKMVQYQEHQILTLSNNNNYTTITIKDNHNHREQGL